MDYGQPRETSVMSRYNGPGSKARPPGYGSGAIPLGHMIMNSEVCSGYLQIAPGSSLNLSLHIAIQLAICYDTYERVAPTHCILLSFFTEPQSSLSKST
jgi:hypothetical protein